MQTANQTGTFNILKLVDQKNVQKTAEALWAASGASADILYTKEDEYCIVFLSK